MNSRRIWLASSNPGKLRELEQAAQGHPLEVAILPDFDRLPKCEEDAATFLGNALRKALHYGRFREELVIAEDSGLGVDALGGEPGVRSARYAEPARAGGPDASDEANNRKLLAALSAVPEEKRTARYVCVLVAVERGEPLAIFSDSCQGRITHEPRGRGGFGYDPVFFFPPLGRTFAEVAETDLALKNQHSHRGKAFRKLVEFLEGRP